MSGEFIIAIVAAIVAVIVFGIPLYAVRRRNRIQSEDAEPETEHVAESSTELSTEQAGEPAEEPTPFANEPKLTQVPAVTTEPIPVNPVPATPAKRVEKQATVAPVVKKKTARKRKPNSEEAEKALKKALGEFASNDKVKPALSKDFANKHLLKLDDKKGKTTKKSGKVAKPGKAVKTTKMDKKPATKAKKSK
jgi:hypothetical protein